MLTKLIPGGWFFRRFTRLDRYIASEVIGTFFGSSIFILFTLLMFQALRLVDFFILHGASAYALLKMAGFMAIAFLPMVLPLAFLISVLIGFGRFSADSELVAMKACGISMFRIASALLIPALVVSGITLCLNLEWVPKGEIALKQTEAKIGSSRAVSAIREGTFTTGFFDLLVFADKVDVSTNRMRKVFIFDEREQDNPLIYVAREAEIVPIQTRTGGTAAMLQLFDGSLHHSNLQTHLYEKMDYEAYHLYLKVDEAQNYSGGYRLEAIPYSDLLDKVRNTPMTDKLAREYQGEFWRRFAVATTPIIFVFLGIGFGTFRYRSAKTGAVLTGLGIIILYWILQISCTGALQKDQLSPFVAMQLPNLAMAILAVVTFIRSGW